MTDHTAEINGTIQGYYFWTCRCGQGSDPVFPSERAAQEAAQEHVRRRPKAAGNSGR